MTLREVPVRTTVSVVKIHGEGAFRRRTWIWGITKGSEIYVRKVAPLGDPVEITVRGYELSLRKADADSIDVNGKRRRLRKEKHEYQDCLQGNPNCGKTTMFNALTGANQYVGNWPGVTVEKKEGRLKTSKGDEEIIITDLRGSIPCPRIHWRKW